MSLKFEWGEKGLLCIILIATVVLLIFIHIVGKYISHLATSRDLKEMFERGKPIQFVFLC